MARDPTAPARPDPRGGRRHRRGGRASRSGRARPGFAGESIPRTPVGRRDRARGDGTVITIAALTVRELFRRRVVYVLVTLTVLSVVLVGWGLDRLVDLAREHGSDELHIQIGVSQVLILIAFMFSFVLAMTAAFVGAPAVGGDLES